MFEVLSAQQRTNQKLEEQFRRANETQEYQVEAMQDMAHANFQMKYDHMFAGYLCIMGLIQIHLMIGYTRLNLYVN